VNEIALFEAIHTARALRRLKPDPIPEDALTKILDAAIRAPSAGNAQNWAFVVVRDREQRASLGAIYRKASDIASVMYANRARPAHMSNAQYHRFMSSGAYLWDHMADAPVLLVPCMKHPALPPKSALPPQIQARYEEERAYADRIRGASIYPAVQNIILACRALGLATLITTNHLRYEAEVKAVLGIPGDVDTYALMPIGYPEGNFGPVARRAVSEVVYADRWANPWPASAAARAR
jgi:nitroreductase